MFLPLAVWHCIKVFALGLTELENVCRHKISSVKLNIQKLTKLLIGGRILILICGLENCIDSDNTFQHILFSSEPDDKTQLPNVSNDFLVDLTRNVPPFVAVDDIVEPSSRTSCYTC
jgi:hypothetical protein